MPSFWQEQLPHFPLRHVHVFSNERTSAHSSSCQRGMNEASSSGFQPHSTGSGSTSSNPHKRQRYPAWKQARFMCCRMPDGEGTSARRLGSGVLIRWSTLIALKLKISDVMTPYTVYTYEQRVWKACSVILSGWRLISLNTSVNVVSRFCCSCHTFQNPAFPCW